MIHVNLSFVMRGSGQMVSKLFELPRRALMLPEAARYDLLLKLPKGENLGAALNLGEIKKRQHINLRRGQYAYSSYA